MVLLWRCSACHQKHRSKNTFAKKRSNFQEALPLIAKFGLEAPKMLLTNIVAWYNFPKVKPAL